MGAPLWDIVVPLGLPVVPGWPSEGILEHFGSLLGGQLGTKISILRYFLDVFFEVFAHRVLGSTFYRKMWPQGSVQEGGM